MTPPDTGNIDLALTAVAEVCVELAAEGCQPTEVATALAQMLGVVVAAVACCEEHAEQAEEVVLEIFEDSLAVHRSKFAAFERGEADFPAVEGHA